MNGVAHCSPSIAKRVGPRRGRRPTSWRPPATQPLRCPKSGAPGPATLRTPGRLRLRRHQDTPATLAGAYPFLAEVRLGSDGVLVGQDLYSGNSFVYDHVGALRARIDHRAERRSGRHRWGGQLRFGKERLRLLNPVRATRVRAWRPRKVSTPRSARRSAEMRSRSDTGWRTGSTRSTRPPSGRPRRLPAESPGPRTSTRLGRGVVAESMAVSALQTPRRHPAHAPHAVAPVTRTRDRGANGPCLGVPDVRDWTPGRIVASASTGCSPARAGWRSRRSGSG